MVEKKECWQLFPTFHRRDSQDKAVCLCTQTVAEGKINKEKVQTTSFYLLCLFSYNKTNEFNLTQVTGSLPYALCCQDILNDTVKANTGGPMNSCPPTMGNTLQSFTRSIISSPMLHLNQAKLNALHGGLSRGNICVYTDVNHT